MGAVGWWFAVGTLGAVGIAGLIWCIHRLCIRLEEAGYLYYRKSGTGGGVGGAFNELDRLTRPSIEHVIQAEDHVEQEECIDGE